MKATLVLLPLLGITYMLFFVNPGEDEVSRVVFIYFNSFLESFQVLPPAPRSGPGCPRPPSVGILPGRALEGQRVQRGRGGGLEAGCSHTGPSPLTHLLCPLQGFFVSVFYCFLNSEVRMSGSQSSGRRGAHWDPRLSVASSCAPTPDVFSPPPGP